MHMIQARFDPRALARWARLRGLISADLGYQAHALLRALFGEHGPQPFWACDEGRLQIQGYADQDADALEGVARALAEPEALAALEPGSLLSKDLGPGLPPQLSRAGFLLDCVPTKRIRDAQGRTREGGIYECALADLGEAAPDPAACYADWLGRKLDGARLESCAVRRRRSTTLHRRGRDRKLARVRLTTVTLEGVLRIDDPDALSARIRAGIGGHRAFGYGMLRLVPAPPA